MRFAIVTIDRYSGVFQSFVDAGWEPLKLFTGPAKDEFSDQRQAIIMAENRGMDIQLSRITDADVINLRDQGCDALIVAGYSWKIPETRGILPYAINFHPSPLPTGRGPYPMPRAILEGRDEWAVACHKLTDQFDLGDILEMDNFPLTGDECHESLDLKIQLAFKRLAGRIAINFKTLWEQAAPQGPGTYWQRATETERMIDFTQPVQSVLRHIRAYGRSESLAKFGDGALAIKRAVGWQEHHSVTPGTIVYFNQQKVIVATQDGFIGLLDVTPVSLT
jgi:methionyl-tRNA formyltransferase